MFLSFIVPVYNTEEYLAECLDSLLRQDIPESEYEIICINDGSTDGSGAILQQYQEKHRNLRIIEQPNRGVAAARNAGLETAQGEYIWFVDSDDFIAQDALRAMREEALAEKVDILNFGAYTFQNTLSDAEKTAYCKQKLSPNSFANHVYATRSLFRRDFLQTNAIMFDARLAYSEDSLFHCRCLSCLPHCRTVQRAYSFVRFRQGSAVAQTDNAAMVRKLTSWCIAADEFRNLYCSCPPELKGRAADLLMGNLWPALSCITNFSGKKVRQGLGKLRKMHLFPFSRPVECTLSRSYQTTRRDFVGKLFDWIYIHSHTVWGFLLLRLWNRAYGCYQKLRR